MIDWFVLLVPFAVLPLVLMFGFVGCPLDRSGLPGPPRLSIPSGLNLTLVSMTVTMKVIGFDDSKSDTLPLTAFTIPPSGGFLTFSIDVESINTSAGFGVGTIGPYLSSDCDCTILIVGQPAPTVLPTAHHDSLTDFSLTVTGSAFDPASYSLA